MKRTRFLGRSVVSPVSTGETTLDQHPQSEGDADPIGEPPALIEFRCRPEDKGVIAEPVRARTAPPGWFKRLPGLDQDELTATNNGLTIKRCVPFLDALSIGWLIPLAATVRLEISEAGQEVVAGWEFDREMVSSHAAFQTAGNPHEPRPMMKFHNPWTIRTPPGWSCLLTPPFNRPHGVIEVLSGVVDTDVYVAPINFPFVAVGEDGVHTLTKGTPLLQVVPFRRENERLEGVVRAESESDAAQREQVYRNTCAEAGWYRTQSRAHR